MRAITTAGKEFEGRKRAGAKWALDGVIAKNPEFADNVARVRFSWLAVEDTKAWEAQATKLAKNGKSN